MSHRVTLIAPEVGATHLVDVINGLIQALVDHQPLPPAHNYEIHIEPTPPQESP